MIETRAFLAKIVIKPLIRAAIAGLLMSVSQSALFTSSAHAMTQDTRALIRGGTYGLIGGTVVGLAVLPLTGSVRGVFIGSSLGLYMGLLMGVYHITHRDDPDNPLRGEAQKPESTDLSDGSRGYLAESRLQSRYSPRTPMEMPLSARFSFSVPVLKF